MILKKHKKMLILPFVLLSCVSFKPLHMDLSFKSIEEEGSGAIDSSNWEGNILIISDDMNGKTLEVKFSEALFPSVKTALTKGNEYSFKSRIKPDGPIEHLLLSDKQGIMAYMADGVRIGSLPGIALKINPIEKKAETAELTSGSESWLVQVGQVEKIKIDGIVFKAFLLNTEIGLSKDQPPFKADLMLIRQ